jgi:hypothetical protein
LVLIIIVVGHEATAAAPWALLLIVRTLFDDAFAIAVWTGFHVRVSKALLSRYSSRLATIAFNLDIEYEIELRSSPGSATRISNSR